MPQRFGTSTMNTAVKIVGTKDLEAFILKMPQDMKRGATAQVLRAGGMKIVKAAKAKAPRRKQKIAGYDYEPGLLKKAIAVNVKNVKREITARIGARSKVSKAVGVRKKGKREGSTVYQTPAHYSHLVEYGTATSAAQPFLRPAVESTSGEVLDAMAKGLTKYLDNYAKRMKKK